MGYKSSLPIPHELENSRSMRGSSRSECASCCIAAYRLQTTKVPAETECRILFHTGRLLHIHPRIVRTAEVFAFGSFPHIARIPPASAILIDPSFLTLTATGSSWPSTAPDQPGIEWPLRRPGSVQPIPNFAHRGGRRQDHAGSYLWRLGVDGRAYGLEETLWSTDNVGNNRLIQRG